MFILLLTSLVSCLPFTEPHGLKSICPRTGCDDLTLLKIRGSMKNVTCTGCKVNLQAFLCHALCTESKKDFSAFPVSPVFCAAGQLACADDSFCRRDGRLAALLSAVSGAPAAVTVANDFSLMPLSAECHEEPLPASTPATVEKKSTLKIWLFVLGGVALGAWISRRTHEKRRKPVWLPVEPEDSSRL